MDILETLTKERIGEEASLWYDCGIEPKGEKLI